MNPSLQRPPQGYTPPANLLTGRNILITGAGGGLGGALAERAAALGATVILVGRNIPPLEAVYDRIVAAGCPTPAIAPINLLTAKWSDFETLLGLIGDSFAQLDGLVHAAAHFKAFSRLEDIEPREWLDSLQVNLTAPYVLTRLCLGLLRKSADASVVWIADSSAREPKPYHAAYGVAKAGADALMGSWAAELAGEADKTPYLRFNSYYPGPMRTALRSKGYLAETADRVAEPDSAVAPLVWLLGPDSRGVTGQQL